MKLIVLFIIIFTQKLIKDKSYTYLQGFDQLYITNNNDLELFPTMNNRLVCPIICSLIYKTIV